MKSETSWSIVRANASGEKVDIDCEVEFDMTDYIPATYWDPPEGGEIEILSIVDSTTGAVIELSADEEKKLIEWIGENPPEPDYPDYD